jgi:hypothetical protein
MGRRCCGQWFMTIVVVQRGLGFRFVLIPNSTASMWLGAGNQRPVRSNTVAPRSARIGALASAKTDRPVYLRKATKPVIAKRLQIDESTVITRGYAQLPWCNR